MNCIINVIQLDELLVVTWFISEEKVSTVGYMFLSSCDWLAFTQQIKNVEVVASIGRQLQSQTNNFQFLENVICCYCCLKLLWYLQFISTQKFNIFFQILIIKVCWYQITKTNILRSAVQSMMPQYTTLHHLILHNYLYKLNFSFEF